MTPGRRKHARVYFHREGSRVIVATLHFNQEGVLVEAEGPLSLTTWTDEDLGESVKLALEQSGTIQRDLRGLKPTDGPALKVSGEPSVRAFQSRFIQIDLSGATEANLLFVIEAIPENSELTLRTILSGTASPVEFAQRLAKVYLACRDRKF